MSFEMDGHQGERVARPSSAGGDGSYERQLFLLAACPWLAMSYAGVPLAMVALAIRRAVRRRLEVGALERAFARTAYEPER
jgi:hypothetical protein